MSLERSPGIYRFPDGTPGPHVDVSRLSQSDRFREILEKDFTRRDAAASFTTTPGIFDQDSVTLLLVGTLGRASDIFQEQVPTLQDLGTKPVLVDYSNQSASQQLLRAQLMDFMDSPLVEGRRISLVGVSLGAYSIIDLAINEPSAMERVDRQILLGPLFSRHDFKDDLPHNLVRRAGRVVNDGTVKFAMPYVRGHIKVDDDPMLAGQHQEVLDAKKQVTHLALSERTLPILTNSPIERYGKITDTPTLIVFWENDETSPQRREVIASAFVDPVVRSVSGNHGWMLSSAGQINPLLSEFLVSSQQELQAAV